MLTRPKLSLLRVAPSKYARLELLRMDGATLVQKPERLSLLTGALRLVWRCAPRHAVALLVLRLTQGVTPLAFVACSAAAIGCAMEAMGGAAAPDWCVPEGMTAREAVWGIGAVLLAVLLLDQALRAVRQIIGEALRQRVTIEVELRIQNQAIAADLALWEDPQFHDLFHRAQFDAAERPVRAFESVLSILQAALTFTLTAALMAVISPWFLLAAAAIAAIAVWLRARAARELVSWHEERTPEERLARYLSALMTGPAHAKEVRAHGMGAALQMRWRTLRERMAHARLRLSRRQAWRELALQGGAMLAMGAALAWLLSEALAGVLTLPLLAVQAQALQRLFMAMNSAVGGVTALLDHTLWLHRLDALFALRPSVAAPAHPQRVPERLSRSLALCAVHFRHARVQREALRGVSLELRCGEITAIAGPNGAGKSTLLRLLARFDDPSSGAVLADGVDLRSFDPAAWREHLGMLFQDFGRYELSVHDGVALGSGGSASVADVDNALNAADATALVRRLPAGRETVPGARFGGGDLSLGEWQKLALARAFIGNSPVLLLDEPTSALDPLAEQRVFAELRRRAAGRVIVVVAHRPTALRCADRVVVLNRGCVVADGTPDEIFARADVFADDAAP